MLIHKLAFPCETASTARRKKYKKGSRTYCPYAQPATSELTVMVTGYKHKIRDSVNCETDNCVYYWKCQKSNCKTYQKCKYIWLIWCSYRKRLSEHKQYVKSSDLGKPSGFHFNQPGHNLSHLSGLILEHVKSSDPFVLKEVEYLYIQRFNTYRNGLNKEQ